ncbi:transglycosylase SLT domain-containing protein [Grimontia sp. S25]|uniref:Transglycosylase SLT domain-containing protein n=1 Tax=Grimontia sedimenti TaxID=2711294 RepID=A0A6M1R657_9GAMM|nr:transglycosylase SLT domain-containing protein [Grimontia sedimenti]NGN97855.1 transglycosylase SLT domain-containing protein [Grimontia sedimenti]
MKTKLLILAVGFNLAIYSIVANANDPFAELNQEVSDLNANFDDEFAEWYQAHLAEFSAWQAEYLKRWDKETDKSIKTWNSHKTDSATTVVINDPELAARTVIDLEKGEVTISHNIDSTKVSSTEVIKEVVKKNEELFKEMGFQSVPEKVTKEQIKPRPVQDQDAVIAELKETINQQTERQMSQLDQLVESIAPDENAAKVMAEKEKAKMRAVEQERIAAAEKAVEESQAKFQKTSGKVVDFSMIMPSNSVSKRAQTFMPYVQRESERQNIEQSLILAIMHTESHFNPKAKSHVPAYGLMQIVPTTAGHDVNKLKRGKNSPMTAKELYVPGVNVETGVAYLDILKRRYLKGINDPVSANYAIIAAYNTGAGNVAKAFGERSVRAAVKRINSMSSEEVYNTLVANLPYDETRKYVRKVRKKISEYEKLETYSSI